MENPPQRMPDEEPQGHEGEHLDPGEIDLTGVVRQDQALADVIGDALVEAEDNDGTLPEWGARSMARALANERDDPLSGALHQFAVTGNADPEDMARELADLYETTADDEIRGWINWLGLHVIRIPDQTEPPQQPAATDGAPVFGADPEAFGRHLREAFAEADARGAPVSNANAQALAGLLSIFLDPDSQLARFADTGDANPVLLSQECQIVRHRTEHVPGADQWITYFEQHLAARADLGRHYAEPPPAGPEPSAEPAIPASKATGDRAMPDAMPHNPLIQEGISRHGDAFHAFLSLPDVDASRDDLLQLFQSCFFGVYDSMDALVHSLVADTISDAERAQWAADGVSLEDLARAVWDIVDVNGKLYVFGQ